VPDLTITRLLGSIVDVQEGISMYRSVLVPLDGSSLGEQALPLAMSITRRAEADLHVVHVHSPLADTYTDGVAYIDPSLDIHLKEHRRAYLDDVAERLAKLSTVRITPAMLEGGIAEGLRAYSQSKDVDLVVMTTHARGPLGRLWLGSVADELVRHLPMPLLLVRPQEAPPDLRQEPVLQHVLLPLDGSVLAEQMIEPAVALGKLMGADYTLLRVIKPPTPAGLHAEGSSLGEMARSVLDRIHQLQEDLRKQAAEYLDVVAERLRGQTLTVRTKVAIEEQPAIAVLRDAVPPAIDLIALETHGRRGLSRMFLGSVADKVIRAAMVPVLVHRPIYQ
jgi:nucleotide-binding universal stress UspA family protein